MFEDDARRPSGRRSKIEITCDIIDVISKGNEKPTRIMQLANVTWDDLIMYLEALIRNQLVSRQVDGKRVTYSLTPSGRTVLGHYQSLRKEVAPLNLEKLTKERITKALTYLPTVGAQESEIYSRLERSVKSEGTKVLSPKVVGKSGAVHTLGLVSERADGSKHGYVVMRDVDETQVMKLFVTQLDTELSIHALYSGQLTPKVSELARAYSLELVPWEEPEKPKSRSDEVDVARFEGKSVLLDVDPAINYETIVKRFAKAFQATGSFVFAFTWKGGPIYSALASMDGVRILSMSAQATYPRPTGKKEEVAVPQDDPAVLLDQTVKQLSEHPKSLLIFDSVSDLAVSLGFEKVYGFLKTQKEIVAKEAQTTALYVVKRNAQDDRTLSLIKGLYTLHLSYDSGGLSVTRET